MRTTDRAPTLLAPGPPVSSARGGGGVTEAPAAGPEFAY